MLKSITVEVETSEHGMLFSADDIKKYCLNNSATYPVTDAHLEALGKEFGKYMLPLMKKYSINRTMVTVYGYDNNYNTVNVKRYTFEQMNGKIYIMKRPYNGSFGFEVTSEESYMDAKEARKALVNMVKEDISNNMTISDKKDNQLTYKH